MASVTFTLPDPPTQSHGFWIDWTFAQGSYLPLGTSLSEGGATELFLGTFRVPTSGTVPRIVLRLAPDQTTNASIAGPNLSDVFEAGGTVHMLATDGSEYTFSFTGADTAEPYEFEPADSADLFAFADAVRFLTDTTLVVTLDDGATPPPPPSSTVTVQLINYTNDTITIGWDHEVAFGTEFGFNNTNPRLSGLRLQYSGNTGEIGIYLIGNDRFSPEFIASGRFLVTAHDGAILEFQIADADTTEPYEWIPPNHSAVVAFANHMRNAGNRNVSLTLTDAPHDPTPVAPVVVAFGAPDTLLDSQTVALNAVVSDLQMVASLRCSGR